MTPRALVGLLLVLACSPAAPTPEPHKTAEPVVTPPPAPEPAKPDQAKNSAPTKRVYTMEELDKIGPRPAPEPPLTQAEIDLIAADTASLSREDRVKQAYARRRKTLQNPDSPLARQIEAMRLAHQRGELPLPELPNKKSAPSNMSVAPPEPAKSP